MIQRNSMIPAIRWSPAIRWYPAIQRLTGSMDFDYPKVYGDTSITDGLVSICQEHLRYLAVIPDFLLSSHSVLSWLFTNFFSFNRYISYLANYRWSNWGNATQDVFMLIDAGCRKDESKCPVRNDEDGTEEGQNFAAEQLECNIVSGCLLICTTNAPP